MKPEKPFASSSSNILEAAQKGDWPKVSVLLRGNPALIFSKADDGTTPLHNAAANGHKDVVELLLSSNAKVNAKDNNGRTPLHHCAGDTSAAKDRKDVAELLLARKAEVSAKDNDGFTPLHYAAGSGYSDVAALLLAKGAEVNAKSNNGLTPLWSAAWKGYKDVAALLLAKGAEVNSKNDDGTTPLHFAASLGYKEVVALLLANGAEVDAKINDGTTPLHLAALKGFKDAAELLLVNGAEVNAKNDDGTTPLHLAASVGFKDVAELLLANSAEVDAKTNTGLTPLHHAALKGFKDVAELLLVNGADVNAKDDRHGATPLHHAAGYGHKDVVELLLAKDADVNARSNNGQTPLQLAAVKGHKEVAEMLTKGADVNPKTNNATHQSGQPVAPESIYTQLSQTLQKPVDEMLSFLETAIRAGAFASAERANLFLVDFLAKANGFTERCCGSYAELLRHCSRLPEVRGTPTVTLANQIRAEVFSKCDAILEQCQRHLHSSSEIIATVSARPQEPGLLTTALQGAATGQLAAGLGKHGKTVGAVGAVLAVSEQWNRRTALLSEHLKAAERAEDAAQLRVPEYLGAIPQLCQDLFDYGCAKCLGAEIDFNAQRDALEKFSEFLKAHQVKLDKATIVGKERAAKAQDDEGAAQESRQPSKSGSGCMVVVGVVCLAVAAAMLLDKDGTSSATSIGIAFMLGVCLLGGGAVAFLENKKSQTTATKTEEESAPPTPRQKGEQ